jgi:hypothetical protein
MARGGIEPRTRGFSVARVTRHVFDGIQIFQFWQQKSSRPVLHFEYESIDAAPSRQKANARFSAFLSETFFGNCQGRNGGGSKSRLKPGIRTMDYQPGLKALLDSSTILVNWALALFAGSAAAIVSTSFEKPKKRLTRLVYFLFPKAWIFLGCSLWAAQNISRRYVAAQFSHDSANLKKLLSKANDDFALQWNMLALGLFVLCAWVVWFIVWWIWWAPDKVQKRASTYDLN